MFGKKKIRHVNMTSLGYQFQCTSNRNIITWLVLMRSYNFIIAYRSILAEPMKLEEDKLSTTEQKLYSLTN